VSNIKVPKRTMSFSDFFKAPTANDDDYPEGNSFRRSNIPALRINPSDMSRGTTPASSCIGTPVHQSSTPRGTTPRDASRRITIAGSAAPPIPPKKIEKVGSRSAPQSPASNKSKLPPASSSSIQHVNKAPARVVKDDTSDDDITDDDEEYNQYMRGIVADKEEVSKVSGDRSEADYSNQITVQDFHDDMNENEAPMHVNSMASSSYGDAPLSKLLIASHNYTAQSFDELSIHTGDTIIVNSRDKEGVWATGLCNGVQGKFPLSHTKPTALFL
jgi:hypothetical protein